MKLCWCDSKLFSSDLKLISSELEIIFVCFQVREIIVQVIASYSDVISSNFESFQAHSPLHYCLFYLQPYSLLPPLRPRSTEETSSYLGLMQRGCTLTLSPIVDLFTTLGIPTRLHRSRQPTDLNSLRPDWDWNKNRRVDSAAIRITKEHRRYYHKLTWLRCECTINGIRQCSHHFQMTQ